MGRVHPQNSSATVVQEFEIVLPGHRKRYDDAAAEHDIYCNTNMEANARLASTSKECFWLYPREGDTMLQKQIFYRSIYLLRSSVGQRGA